MTCRVSVLMPVFNGESYVSEAISSVLNQSYTDFELLIINDGSTDKSLKIIKSFNDQRIRVLSNNENKGLIYSLNRGISESKGNYIARMDADDVASKDRLEVQLKFMELNTDVGVVSSDYYVFNKKSKKYIQSISGDSKIRTFLLFSATICHPTLMIRKSVLTDNNLHYSSFAKHVEDFDLWTNLALFTKFETINLPLLNYRDHESQVSHIYSDIQKINSDSVRKNYLDALQFKYTSSELMTHNLIGSNQRILSKLSLKSIENWLNNLIQQNKVSKKFNDIEFKEAIAKVWKDCCGNTSLGLYAYYKFIFSDIKKYSSTKDFLEIKMLAKCIIRWIK